MNVANRITLVRIMMVPLFMIFLLNETIPWGELLSALIFIVAAVTDGVDGYVARRYNQITSFGKVMDPIADKLLIAAALICLVELGRVASWVAVIILAREFMVTSLRIITIADGQDVAANMWGKIKTVVQVIAVVLLLIERMCSLTLLGINIPYAMLLAAVVITVISGVTYFKSAWGLLELK